MGVPAGPNRKCCQVAMQLCSTSPNTPAPLNKCAAGPGANCRSSHFRKDGWRLGAGAEPSRLASFPSSLCWRLLPVLLSRGTRGWIHRRSSTWERTCSEERLSSQRSAARRAQTKPELFHHKAHLDLRVLDETNIYRFTSSGLNPSTTLLPCTS